MITFLAIPAPIEPIGPIYRIRRRRWACVLLVVFSVAGPLAFWLQPGPYGCALLALGVSFGCFWPSRYWWMAIDDLDDLDDLLEELEGES